MNDNGISGNATIDALFDNYTGRNHHSLIEENREASFLNLHKLIESSKEASDALISFQYAAMRAAFYEGFATAMELTTGTRPGY